MSLTYRCKAKLQDLATLGLFETMKFYDKLKNKDVLSEAPGGSGRKRKRVDDDWGPKSNVFSGLDRLILEDIKKNLLALSCGDEKKDEEFRKLYMKICRVAEG